MSKARDIADLLDSAGKVTAEDLDVGAIGGRRNLIINGAMQVSQRGDYTSATTAYSTVYYVDRWVGNSTVANTIQHISTNQPTEINGKSTKYSATATGSGIVGGLQHVEDYGLFSNRTVTLSAWVKSNSSDARLAIKHDETWPIIPSSAQHSGGGSWEKLTMTVDVNETVDTRFLVLIGMHSSSVGTVSITSGDYIEFTGVQLELGSVATPFEHRSYGEELALCQRYYQKWPLNGNSLNAISATIQATNGSCSFNYLLVKPTRANPTVTVNGTATGDRNSAQPNEWAIYVNGSYRTSQSVAISGTPTVDAIRINIDTDGTTGGQAASVYLGAGAGLSIDAEL